jgi:hypothetical protein
MDRFTPSLVATSNMDTIPTPIIALRQNPNPAPMCTEDISVIDNDYEHAHSGGPGS